MPNGASLSPTAMRRDGLGEQTRHTVQMVLTSPMRRTPYRRRSSRPLAKEGRPGASCPYPYKDCGTCRCANACQHWALDVWPRQVGCGRSTRIFPLSSPWLPFEPAEARVRAQWHYLVVFLSLLLQSASCLRRRFGNVLFPCVSPPVLSAQTDILDLIRTRS